MIQDAFWGILIPFLGTSLGAGCVFFLKNSLRDGIQHALTGFAAGVMVAASVWSLLIPEMSQGQHSNVGTVFFAVGFSVMMVLDVALGVMVGGRKRNLFQNLRKCLNSLTEVTAGRIIFAEGPLSSGFLRG